MQCVTFNQFWFSVQGEDDLFLHLRSVIRDVFTFYPFIEIIGYFENYMYIENCQCSKVNLISIAVRINGHTDCLEMVFHDAYVLREELRLAF